MEDTPTKSQFLLNPVDVIEASDVVLTDTDKSQLHTLVASYNSACDEINALQLANKKTSRQIGIAKKNNESIDALKQLMQKNSQQLKTLKNNAETSKNLLLEYYPYTSDTTHATSEASSTKIPPRYSSEAVSTDTTITLVDDSNRSRYIDNWNHFVDTHPHACIHHRFEWLDIFKQSYGHECLHYVAESNDKNIVGILPTTHLQSRLFGNLLCSMPYFQRAGAIAHHAETEQRLIESAIATAKTKDIEHIEFRDVIPFSQFPSQSHKVNMVLTLAKTKDDLWQSFSSKLRAQIKRPQRENTSISIGHKELLDDFYRVYSRNMRDLGSPVHSKKFISNILEAFPDNSWLTVVYLNNKAVSTGLLLGYKDTMEIPLASTIRDVNHLSINMLLYWEVLQFAIKKHYSYFDFGRSTNGANTYRFKKQWGAVPKQLHWHYWLNDGVAMPGLNPSNPKFALMIKLWKLLPVKLSCLIGPYIVKNIP